MLYIIIYTLLSYKLWHLIHDEKIVLQTKNLFTTFFLHFCPAYFAHGFGGRFGTALATHAVQVVREKRHEASRPEMFLSMFDTKLVSFCNKLPN